MLSSAISASSVQVTAREQSEASCGLPSGHWIWSEWCTARWGGLELIPMAVRARALGRVLSDVPRGDASSSPQSPEAEVQLSYRATRAGTVPQGHPGYIAPRACCDDDVSGHLSSSERCLAPSDTSLGPTVLEGRSAPDAGLAWPALLWNLCWQRKLKHSRAQHLARWKPVLLVKFEIPLVSMTRPHSPGFCNCFLASFSPICVLLKFTKGIFCKPDPIVLAVTELTVPVRTGDLHDTGPSHPDSHTREGLVNSTLAFLRNH